MQESDAAQTLHKKLLEKSTKNLDVVPANGYSSASNMLARRHKHSRQDDAPPIAVAVRTRPTSNVACSPIVLSPRTAEPTTSQPEKKDFCCQEVMTDPVLGINNFDSKGVTTETFGGHQSAYEVRAQSVVKGVESVVQTTNCAC